MHFKKPHRYLHVSVPCSSKTVKNPTFPDPKSRLFSGILDFGVSVLYMQPSWLGFAILDFALVAKVLAPR